MIYKIIYYYYYSIILQLYLNFCIYKLVIINTKKYKMRKNLERLNKYVNIHECKEESVDVLFTDFIKSSNETIIDKQDVFVHAIKIANDILIKDTIDKRIYEELKNNIKKCNDFNINEEKDLIKLEKYISFSSEKIAKDGRYGKADVIVMSEKNYLKIIDKLENFDDFLKKQNITLIINEYCKNELFLYVKVPENIPGLIGLVYKDRFSIESIGFFPEKQIDFINFNL